MNQENATPENPTPSLNDLQDKLDTLWKKHLTLLDQYHKAHSEIQKHMSSVRIMLTICTI